MRSPLKERASSGRNDHKGSDQIFIQTLAGPFQNRKGSYLVGTWPSFFSDHFMRYLNDRIPAIMKKIRSPTETYVIVWSFFSSMASSRSSTLS